MKTIPNFAPLPYGLSKRISTRDNQWEIFLIMPLMKMPRKHVYNVTLDDFEDGWFTCRFLMMMGKAAPNCFNFRLAWGWAKA